MGERGSQFAAALEERKRTGMELMAKQRQIIELQKLAERGTPEQKAQAIRKLHKLLNPKEK